MKKAMPTPVGVREIAVRAGVTEIAVRKWVTRHAATPFPRSVGPVSGRDAYWWHEIIDWLAATGKLAKVTRLDHPDPLVERHITVTYDPPARNWILAEHNTIRAVQSWDGPNQKPGRPWMYSDEDDLVEEIRQRLLDGWTIGSWRGRGQAGG